MGLEMLSERCLSCLVRYLLLNDELSLEHESVGWDGAGKEAVGKTAEPRVCEHVRMR